MRMDDEGSFLRKMTISIFEATSTERTEYLKEQFEKWHLMNDSLLQSRYRQEITLGGSAFLARRTFRPSRILRGVLTPVWRPEAGTLEDLDTGSRWLHVLKKINNRLVLMFASPGCSTVKDPTQRGHSIFSRTCSYRLPMSKASKVFDSKLQTGVRKPGRILDGLNEFWASHKSGEPTPREHFFTSKHAAAG